ncbi:MAG: acyltransferase family protein [Saprospiraceae bacterium]
MDSVRGIAALMVVFYHFIGWHWGERVEYHLASIVFNGSDAVSFFFVLSGFVLSFKYFQRGGELNIKKYTFNRVLRLYPAFIVAVLMNFFYWYRGLIYQK